MEYVVTNADDRDLPVICTLFEEAIAFLKANHFIGWTNYDKAFIQSDLREGLLYKITRGQEIACIFSVCYTDALIWREKEKGDAIYLHRIVLNRNFAGEKMFQKVLEWAMQKAKNKNLDYVRMDTWADNEKIIAYYKTYGFSFIENYTTPDTEDLPVQHRKLTVALLELSLKPQSTMIITGLKSLFSRDLKKLHDEISMYEKETDIWKTENRIANSAGNLCLHLVGNLNTYIGKEIGGTNYIRNREAEFSLKNIPKEELLEKINETIKTVNDSLGKLDDGSLGNEYPLLVFEEKTTTGYMLMHLSAHLSYHLGQINYHRRMISVS